MCHDLHKGQMTSVSKAAGHSNWGLCFYIFDYEGLRRQQEKRLQNYKKKKYRERQREEAAGEIETRPW